MNSMKQVKESVSHGVKTGIDVEPMATIFVRQRSSDTTLERPASTKDPEGGNKSSRLIRLTDVYYR